ncbi:hypothetical protein CRV03_14025, partial [Arcobacter sp. F155]
MRRAGVRAVSDAQLEPIARGGLLFEIRWPAIREAPCVATNMESEIPPDEAGEISREDLYEQVWTTPINHLAAKFGITDFHLARVCSALNV